MTRKYTNLEETREELNQRLDRNRSKNKRRREARAAKKKVIEAGKTLSKAHSKALENLTKFDVSDSKIKSVSRRKSKKVYSRKSLVRPEFIAIINRVEEVRNFMGLNKSVFCQNFGMKPQTYNNFLGKQGSKPNIELIIGVCDYYGVNYMWLLNGTGDDLLKQSIDFMD